MESFVRHFPSRIQQGAKNMDDVNLLTQLSIGESCDSSPNTSAQTDRNSKGSLVFPLGEKHENIAKHSKSMSWHVLVQFLKSQQIVRDFEKIKKLKRKNKFILNTKEFLHRCIIGRKETELTKLNFPLKPNVAKSGFPKNYKRHQTSYSRLKRYPKLRKFPMHQELPAQEYFSLFSCGHDNNLKFPLKLPPNKRHFPIENEPYKEMQISFYIQNVKPLQMTPSEAQKRDRYEIKKFPCQVHLKNQKTNNGSLSEFPSRNSATNWCREESSKCSNALHSLATLSTTAHGQKINVFQVQHAQFHEAEIPRSLPTDENKRSPPHVAVAKTMHDEQGAVNVVADMSSINSIHPYEVGYYAERIEWLKDAIVALFEKIQNLFATNHNARNTKRESINAAIHAYGDDNIRFALTPPLSVTSVQNAESNANKEVLDQKCDLADLYDCQVVQIVECSEALDTLVETVDYGVKEEQNESTGSIIVKSEESTSPNFLTPTPHGKCEYTSHENYKYVSELLQKENVSAVTKVNNVGLENNLQFDPIKIIDTSNGCPTPDDISARTGESKETVVKITCETNLTSETVHQMTVTHLERNDHESIYGENQLQVKKPLEIKHASVFDDLKVDEMKFEMNRMKGALPNSVSERSVGKHVTAAVGVGTTSGSTRLSADPSLEHKKLLHSQTSTRNYQEGSTLKKAIPKHSTITIDQPREEITNRSAKITPSSNQTLKNRAALNSIRPANESNTDSIPQRRPSLGNLRRAQSTTLLSTDVPCLATLNSGGISTNSLLENILPERTRLRRQRHLRTQDSQNETEDPIERLNRLKARISASLTEVKGVLRQYSTEAENESDNARKTAATSNTLRETKDDEQKEGPITFRFIKKVRRRSLFADDDENEQKDTETKTTAQVFKKIPDNFEKQPESTNQTDNCKLAIPSALPVANSENMKVFNKSETTKPPLLGIAEEEGEKLLKDMTETVNKSLSSNEEEIQNKTSKDNPTTTQDLNKSESSSTHETTRKTKKKIIEPKEHVRRVSLAAVEGSRIEPPARLAIPAKIQRRPSDSEAIVKKKLITAKISTSGAVKEVTPKPKIVKVKKASVKKNDNNNKLAITQAKLKEEEITLATQAAANYKNDDLVKPIEKGNKSINTDKKKNVLMPKAPGQQQQINQSEIIRQANSLLPTQLAVDDAAPLDDKTIEVNTVLPPKQQQQQQHHHQHKVQDQQATTKFTATNFKSHDLQTENIMLENVATGLSLPADSEANGQTNRENIVQQEDLHDLLLQETTIIRPTTDKERKIKETEDRSNVRETVSQPQSSKKLIKNSESVETTIKEESQKFPSQYQQVIATTHVAHTNSEGHNIKHDNIKVEASLKEPCIDKTTTSTLLGEEHHKEHQQQQYLPTKDEQSTASVGDTKTISSPHISISSTSDITHKTRSASLLPSESRIEERADVPADQQNTMPELQLTPAPVQTVDIISHPEQHDKKIVINKTVSQTPTAKIKKGDLEKTKPPQDVKQVTIETLPPQHSKNIQEAQQVKVEEPTQEAEQFAIELQATQGELIEECSESTEISESSTSLDSPEVTSETPKKERKVKKKVIIKREKRRLSIGDNFFHPGNNEESQNAAIETLEKPIAYVTDEEDEQSAEKDEDTKKAEDQMEEQKPLKSCILHKEYNIGDEVLYAERFKKTQIKWRHGRIKERITSISYLLDIDGKDVSSHINYLKKYTGRKVSFGGKEYLEIDYEQLAEDEEKAERLKRRSYSIWNMV